MAAGWSCENVVAEHRDLQLSNAMALDHRGEYLLLAGRRNLALICLDNPSVVKKRVSRTQQKYDVTAAEWNPVPAQGHTFAISSGERAEISACSDGAGIAGVTSLKAHTRTITDLNWHKTESHLLATCSIDTFVHIWDTRETRKPVASLSAIAGASQVKWNKLNPHILASGHDSDVRVWDQRKPSQPLHYIAAHLSKIHSLDWSPNHENQLVTSSNDCTVKFFDTTNPRRAENFINTLSPVWRARYTPFGEGVVTVVVPQLRRGENSLLLWSLTDMSSPVHTFVGHSDVVLEFEYRHKSTEPNDYQLVTWARDHSLRIWKIDQHLQKLCGRDTEEEALIGESSDAYSITSSELHQGELDIYAAVDDSSAESKGGTGSSDGATAEIASVLSVTPSTTDSEIIKELVGASASLTTKQTFSAQDEEFPSIAIEAGQDVVAPLASIPEVRTEDKDNPESGSSILLGSSAPIGSSVGAADSSSGTALGTSIGSTNSVSVGQPPMTLGQEFSLLNTSLDNSQSQVNSVEVLTDLDKRICQVTAKHGTHTVVLNITFPNTYPRHHAPTFKFGFGTTIDYACKTELSKVLKNTATQYLRKRKACLEPCIRLFVAQMKALLVDERVSSVEATMGSSSAGGYQGQMYGSYQDHNIPFPRTSGARFCSAGILVCFARPTFMKKGVSRSTEASIPRSLTALGPYLANFTPQMSANIPTSPKYNYMYHHPMGISHSPSTDNNVSVSHYYYQDRKVKSKRGKGNDDDGGRATKAGSVIIYDIKNVLPFSRELGESYILDEDDIVGTCTRNRDVAAAAGRKDLVQLWSLAAHTASLGPRQHSMEEGTDSDAKYGPWTSHPFATKMINSLLNHYLNASDVQTAAMLSCVFGNKMEAQSLMYPRKNRADSSSTGGSPYNTIHGINIHDWEEICMVRHNRSNSEGSLAEAARPSHDVDVPALEATDPEDNPPSRFLDPSRNQQYDELRRAYADILYRWGLLKQRAMVLKYLQAAPAPHRGVEFQTECGFCGQSAKGPQCLYCRRFSFSCAICHIAVKGACNFCMVCGHGGHASHMIEWYRNHSECPTGCGCDCIAEMNHLFK